MTVRELESVILGAMAKTAQTVPPGSKATQPSAAAASQSSRPVKGTPAYSKWVNDRYAAMQRRRGQAPAMTTAGGTSLTRLTNSTYTPSMQSGVGNRAKMRANLGTMDNYAGQELANDRAKLDAQLDSTDRLVGLNAGHLAQYGERFGGMSDADRTMLQSNRAGYNLLRHGGMSHDAAMAAMRKGRVQNNGTWSSTGEYKQLLRDSYARAFNSPEGMARAQAAQTRQLMRARQVDAAGRKAMASWGHGNLGPSYVTPGGVVVTTAGSPNSAYAKKQREQEAYRARINGRSMALARADVQSARDRAAKRVIPEHMKTFDGGYGNRYMGSYARNGFNTANPANRGIGRYDAFARRYY